MEKMRRLSLFIAISFWAVIIGGIVYSHIVYFPPYLSNLPESTSLVSGRYGLHEERFWMFIHPLTILFTVLTLILNWGLKERRNLILITTIIYALSIVVTMVYFLPALKAFAESGSGSSTTPSEWFRQGQEWQHRSWIRGLFMFIAFITLLMALTKDKNRVADS
jgi:hypothetical protein